MTKWECDCLNKWTCDMICIMITFKWNNLKIKNVQYGYIDIILLLFLILAPNTKKLFKVFITLWVLPSLVPMHDKYPNNLSHDISK
jgi:hypothetical protein